MTREDALRLVETVCGPPRHLASWATPDTPKDGWHMTHGVGISHEKVCELASAIMAVVAAEREREVSGSDG